MLYYHVQEYFKNPLGVFVLFIFFAIVFTQTDGRNIRLLTENEMLLMKGGLSVCDESCLDYEFTNSWSHGGPSNCLDYDKYAEADCIFPADIDACPMNFDGDKVYCTEMHRNSAQQNGSNPYAGCVFSYTDFYCTGGIPGVVTYGTYMCTICK